MSSRSVPIGGSRQASGRARVGVPPFERVIEDHGRAVLRFCPAQVGAQRADDCFPETMLAALRAYGQWQEPGAIRAWLFSIAARKAIDAHRAHARAPMPSGEIDEEAGTEDTSAGDQALWERVRALPDKQRQAVMLRYRGDLTHREIALVMQISEPAARRNVFPGLKQLRKDTQTMTTPPTASVGERVHELDWEGLRAPLDRRGYAITSPLLDADECRELAALFDAGLFRSTIEMARYRFGDGRYRYFDHPLPDKIAALRSAFYRHLAPIANDWAGLLRGDNAEFPLGHEELLERCRAAGQERPTPLIF